MIEQALPEMCPVMQYGIMYGVWDGRNLAQREEIKAAYEAGAEIRVELTWLREGRRSLRRRFVLFHALNPHIYALFTYYANELLDARAAQGGTPRGSHWQVMQRVRWDSYLQTEPGRYRPEGQPENLWGNWHS